jgi:phage terminase small subunit
MALTPKQQRFVQEYLIDLNATQAAIRAGYSPKTARSIGDENLTKPDIAAAIAAAQDERRERVELTQDMVVEGLLVEAKLTGEGSSHSARVAAWTQLGKHLGMFRDRVEHTGGTTVTHVYMPPNGRDDDPAPAG